MPTPRAEDRRRYSSGIDHAGDKFLERSRRGTSSDKTRVRPKRVRGKERNNCFFENERGTLAMN